MDTSIFKNKKKIPGDDDLAEALGGIGIDVRNESIIADIKELIDIKLAI